jgi:hypothetical protein
LASHWCSQGIMTSFLKRRKNLLAIILGIF